MNNTRLLRNTEECPRGISRARKFQSVALRGDWSRVYPTTSHHVLFLQMLENNVDKYAPEHGEGILVRTDKISNI